MTPAAAGGWVPRRRGSQAHGLDTANRCLRVQRTASQAGPALLPAPPLACLPCWRPGQAPCTPRHALAVRRAARLLCCAPRWEAGDEELELGPEDEAALAAFMAPGAADYRQRSLSDLILDKIRAKQAEGGLSQIPE